MLRRLWTVNRARQGITFGVWYAFFVVAAVILPNDHYRGPLSVSVRLVILATAVATLIFALSLPCYFFEAWKRAKLVTNRVSYRAWMIFETLIGVPFATVCYVFAGIGLWVALIR